MHLPSDNTTCFSMHIHYVPLVAGKYIHRAICISRSLLSSFLLVLVPNTCSFYPTKYEIFLGNIFAKTLKPQLCGFKTFQ